MKKLTLAIFSTLLFGASSSVLAVTSWGGSASGSTPNEEITTAECTLLNETVDLTVSAHVVGAWACDDATNVVEVGTCHEGGSRKPLSCASYSSVNQISGCTDTSGNSDLPDYASFFATSKGGVMQERQLGAKCTVDSIKALTWAN